MNKTDLIEYAHSLGLTNVDDSWIKRNIQDAIDGKLKEQSDQSSSPGEDTSPGDEETSPGEGEEGPGASVGVDSPDVDAPGPGTDSGIETYDYPEPPRVEAYVIRRPGSRIPGVIRLPGRRSIEITQF